MKKLISIALCMFFSITIHAQQYKISTDNFNDSAAFSKSVQTLNESVDAGFNEARSVVFFDMKLRIAFLKNDIEKMEAYVDSFISLTGKTDLRVANIFSYYVYAKAKKEQAKNTAEDFTTIFTRQYKTAYDQLTGDVQYRLFTNYNYKYQYPHFAIDEIEELINKPAHKQMLVGDDALDLIYLYATYRLYTQMWCVLSISPELIGTK